MVLRILFLIALALVFAAPASARGGGGCVEEGTSVLTPSGPVPIERLRPGDMVLGIDQAAVHPVTVRSVIQVRPDEYVELTVDGRTLRVTPEHPVGTAPGVFRLASRLREGDAVVLREGDKTVAAALSSLARVRGRKPAYNLLVSPAGTYLANTIVVHNKGCFLPDTLVRTTEGTEMPISAVRQGDRLLAFELGIKAGQLFSILRVAVTGQPVSPPLFESMAVIGKEKVMSRLQYAITMLERG